MEKLAEREQEKSDACVPSLPCASEEELRQRILRQKMRVRPRRPAAEKCCGEESSATD